MQTNDVIIKPVLTEKATSLVQASVYAFEVTRRANKLQIKNAIEKLYPVKVSQVRVLSRVGKKRRTGKRMLTKQLPARKIAYIYLSSGKIGLFPQP